VDDPASKYAMVTDKIDDNQPGFALCRTQTTAKLLQKDNFGFCWTQHDDSVDVRHVHAFVEQVDSAYSVELTVYHRAKGLAAWIASCASKYRRSFHTAIPQPISRK
jgi:hypothetical protein